MSEDKITLIMLAVLTVALVFACVPSKFDNLNVDITAVLFLLVSTAVGAAIVTERRLRKK
ncbi:hypothetical protein [Bacillus cereus]|uniref:hypothetical protein n=1 Tax=Bacillus cereus TaxID=1396 RepID=UPI000BEDC78D|nr:hypothetical protein [Bacillus cereus]MEC3021278.1 hypothetical protein [Bacillus cereus]MEC3260724.1 hypothetical protein [Bacillus cereus]PDY66846.1 hypothetical protein COM88_12315 [Bacillus cereus]PGQ80343.1 hypothetical protein COA26_15935 [Bacillus cereus]